MRASRKAVRSRRSRGRRVRGEQEQRRDEHEEPSRRQGADDAVAFPAGGVEVEERIEAEIGLPRLRARGEEAEHQDERDETAGVAHRPARAGQAAEAIRRHEAEHHRIVERRRGLRGDGRDRVAGEHARDRGRSGAGRREPEEGAGRGEDAAGESDPGLLRPRRVGEAAAERRQDGEPDPGRRGGVAPERLALHGVADHRGREVGREHEGADQGKEGLAGPVEQEPAADARSPGGGSGHALARSPSRLDATVTLDRVSPEATMPSIAARMRSASAPRSAFQAARAPGPPGLCRPPRP